MNNHNRNSGLFRGSHTMAHNQPTVFIIRDFLWIIPPSLSREGLSGHSIISVSFWNLVGAGIFGFLINPSIALYYMQGLNTTPVHGHAALFGVFGMLGILVGTIALALFVIGLKTGWSIDKTMKLYQE